MTLCIGGPLDGKQAPTGIAREGQFFVYQEPTPPLLRSVYGEAELRADMDISLRHVRYRLTPIDVLVGGTSIEARVFADDSMTGRDIAKGVVRLIDSLGSPA